MLADPLLLVDRLERTLSRAGAAERCKSIDLRSRLHPYPDVRMIFGERSWLGSAAGRALVGALQAMPEVESVRRKQATLSLRLADGWLVELGTRLLGETELSDPGTLAGAPYLVGFAGPNTSKALHVGHLRNVVLGHALASALATAGASVTRHSLVGDIGRSVGEAMAGYLRSGAGSEAGTDGAKSDHLVGRCYRAYLAAVPAAAIESVDPNEREQAATGDEADRLLVAWKRGDAEVVALWRKLRRWVLDGHAATLQRLGVQLGRVDFESATFARCQELLESGLAGGVLTRSSGGAVVFHTGRPEFETMVMRRTDGFPTEHARLLAVYERILGDCPSGCRYLDLSGSEWQPANAVHMELMARLVPGPHRGEHLPMFHGMLTLGDDKVSSSRGEPELIDDLLDRLAAEPAVVALAREGGAAAGTVAEILVKGYLLCWPTSKPMPYRDEVLLDESRNPGWTLARAWGRARTLAPTAALDPNDSERRLLALGALELRRRLVQAARQLSLDGLVSHVVRLAGVVAASAAPAQLAPLAQPLLDLAFGSLGLPACDGAADRRDSHSPSLRSSGAEPEVASFDMRL